MHGTQRNKTYSLGEPEIVERLLSGVVGGVLSITGAASFEFRLDMLAPAPETGTGGGWTCTCCGGGGGEIVGDTVVTV